MPVRGKDSYSIQSVEHALDLLEALCEEGDGFRISHLSRKLGLNKTSVFRLLATFENRGYVERQLGSGHYRPGLSAYEISQKFLSRMGLLRKARPVMERLVRECNESVYLVVRRHEDALFLDMADTMQQVKIVSLIGRRYPLAQTAAGKVILAFSFGQQADDEKSIPIPLGPDEISRIRRQGYDADHSTLGEGIASLAVPLFNAGANAAGSLVLLGPDFRLPPEKVEGILLPLLRDAGEIISSKLGNLGRYLDRDQI